MTRSPDTSEDTTVIAKARQSGIPRYHDGFSVLVLRRNATPPHSEMNAVKEKSPSMNAKGSSRPVVITRYTCTVSRTLIRGTEKNTADMTTSARYIFFMILFSNGLS
jgi:hypothetical protein